MAAQEAIGADFALIEPAHLLLAILKFAELGKKQYERILQDLASLDYLISERDEVRRRLAEYSADIARKSKEIRYRLRKKQGRGSHPYDGKAMIHRSDAARKICKNAERLARESGSLVWCAHHLLAAMIASPVPDIREICQAAGIAVSETVQKTPLLDEIGTDMNASCSNRKKLLRGEMKAIEKDPVLKVLVDGIKGTERASFLLIQDGRRSARDVVEGLIRSPASGKKKVIELKFKKIMKLCAQKADLSLFSLMKDLFEEACSATDVILFISDFDAFFDTENEKDVSDLFHERLTRKQISVFAATDKEKYRKHIESDANWRNLIHPLWIHDLKLPRQL
jgi:ATP-dependent Clp protease ATP-binding subunit ClpA